MQPELDDDQSKPVIEVNRPTGPRLTLAEKKSLGELVIHKAKELSETGAKFVVTTTRQHKVATTIAASTVFALATHFIVALIMMSDTRIAGRPYVIGGSNTSFVVPEPVSGYVGPGDVQSGAAAWWGLRAYSNAKAGTVAARICGVDFTTCTDVNTLANGNFDVATAAALPQCSGTCYVAVLYDQTGNSNCGGACNLANAANGWPVLTFNCIGTLPCMTHPGGSSNPAKLMSNAISITMAAPFSGSAMGKRTAGTAYADIIGTSDAAIQIGFGNSANLAMQYAGLVETVSATDGLLHEINVLHNGASSILNVNGSGTTTNPGSTDLTGRTFCFGVCTNGLTGITVEAGWWTGDKSGTFNTLCNNQRVYWSGTGSC